MSTVDLTARLARIRAGENPSLAGLRAVAGCAVARGGPARERDARPFHRERSGTGLAVGGVVQHGEDVVEQVFDAQAEVFQVATGGARRVGAASRAIVITPDTADGMRG